MKEIVILAAAAGVIYLVLKQRREIEQAHAETGTLQNFIAAYWPQQVSR